MNNYLSTPKKEPSRSGFTLIELLVVIGILAVLLAIVLIAINPARQFSQANNTQRRNDVTTILNAVHQYAADNKGALPTGITATATDVGSGTGEVNLCTSLVTQYVANMPLDPSSGSQSPSTGTCADSGTTYTTGYQISKSASDNRITVTAPGAELGETITVTR